MHKKIPGGLYKKVRNDTWQEKLLKSLEKVGGNDEKKKVLNK